MLPNPAILSGFFKVGISNVIFFNYLYNNGRNSA